MKRISLPSSSFMVILFNFNFKLLYSPFFSMMAQKVIQLFYLAMERCEPLTGNWIFNGLIWRFFSSCLWSVTEWWRLTRVDSPRLIILSSIHGQLWRKVLIAGLICVQTRFWSSWFRKPRMFHGVRERETKLQLMSHNVIIQTRKQLIQSRKTISQAKSRVELFRLLVKAEK